MLLHSKHILLGKSIFYILAVPLCKDWSPQTLHSHYFQSIIIEFVIRELKVNLKTFTFFFPIFFQEKMMQNSMLIAILLVHCSPVSQTHLNLTKSGFWVIHLVPLEKMWKIWSFLTKNPGCTLMVSLSWSNN